MPIFEYSCNNCGHRFEAIILGKQKASCPKCHSSRLAPQLSVFAAPAKGSNSKAASSACGTCGDPRGPGACSMSDLD